MLSCVRAVPRVLVCGACQRAQSTAPTVRAREELAAEGNLPIAERGEGTADAPQAAGLNAARHFPQIRRHGKSGTGMGNMSHKSHTWFSDRLQKNYAQRLATANPRMPR